VKPRKVDDMDAEGQRGLTRRGLEARRVAELRSLAKGLGISLAARRKADIIGEILRKQKAGRRARPPAAHRRAVPWSERPVPIAFKGGPGPPERNRLTALAVEPTRIFAHWEITRKTAGRGRPSLRVRDVTGGKAQGEVFEIGLTGRAGAVYLRVLPGRLYEVGAGVVTPGGRFIRAGRPSRVSTPPSGPSAEEAGLPEEYFRFVPLSYRPA
jgi:hypothetical protein